MNKVMLIGNVGREPEVRYVDQGVAVARFPLATTERGYTLPNGTQVPDRTDWHDIVLWRRLAEVVEKYVHKGDKLYIEGRVRYTNYDNKHNKKRWNHFNSRKKKIRAISKLLIIKIIQWNILRKN